MCNACRQNTAGPVYKINKIMLLLFITLVLIDCIHYKKVSIINDNL